MVKNNKSVVKNNKSAVKNNKSVVKNNKSVVKNIKLHRLGGGCVLQKDYLTYLEQRAVGSNNRLGVIARDIICSFV